MKASAFNGDVEILLFNRFLTFHGLVGYTATSMPTKKRLDQRGISIRLTATQTLLIKLCNWLFYLWRKASCSGYSLSKPF